MSLEEVIKRILFRWWLILIIMVVFTLSFFSWTKSTNYQASIGLGISFNSQDFLNTTSGKVLASTDAPPQSASEYIYSLSEFSKYLSARFSSVEVQGLVAQKAGLGIQSYDSKKPFYTVTPQTGGYISINYEVSSKEESEKFIKAIKETYSYLIKTERQSKELAPFKVEPKTEFIESVTTVSRPVQFQILPTITGLLVGIAISALLPFKKF
jgi:hypothetical protein